MRNEVIRALAAALIAAVLLAVGFNRAWPLNLDIGTNDDRFVSGFLEIEQFGDTRVRWTDGDAAIAIPGPPLGASSLLALRLLNSRPPEYPDPHLELSADGRAIGGFEAIRRINGARIYRVLVPAGGRFDWATRIGIHSDTITLPNDHRPLGIVVDRTVLTPLPAGPLVPSLWLLVWAAAIGALGYALPRSIGLGRGLALGVALILAVLVAWAVAMRPIEVLPFVQRIAALLGIGCAGVWLARLLAPPVATTDDRTGTTYRAPTTDQGLDETRRQDDSGQPHLVSNRLSVRGADLPIYLAIAWWLAPLFQLAMTADDAVNVRPGVPTMWIGGIAALLLFGVGGWYLLRGRAVPAEQRTSAIRRWSLAILVGAAVVHLGYMLAFAFSRQGPDFWILFKGAREWARGGSLYDLNAIETNHFGYVFKVPPFYGMLFVPFAFQDGERILLFHRVINAILIGATTLVWLRMWRLRLLSAASAGVLILINFRPLADTLAFGQIDLALLLILTLALWALQKERDLAAGVLVALGTLFKIYPVLLLAFFVVKRRWWALAGFALGMLAFNAIAIAVMGWEMHRIYLTEVLPKIGGTTSWVENQTIFGFLSRLIAPPTEAAIFYNRTITLLAELLAGAAALFACALALRPARPGSTTHALQYSLFPLLMVLIVPAAWMHYETLLFIPFAALLLHLHDREIGLPRAAALALSFALVAYGNQWSFYDGTVMGVLTIIGVSYKFYGMLLLGGVLASTLLEERAALALPRWLPIASLQRQTPRVRG